MSNGEEAVVDTHNDTDVNDAVENVNDAEEATNEAEQQSTASATSNDEPSTTKGSLQSSQESKEIKHNVESQVDAAAANDENDNAANDEKQTTGSIIVSSTTPSKTAATEAIPKEDESSSTTTSSQPPTPIKPAPPSTTTPQSHRQAPNTSKIKIHLVAVGSAPMLKKNKFSISSQEQFSTLQERMRKMLKVQSGLFLYINQGFVPSPEDLVGDLGDLFSIGGELQIHYSIQEAWG